MKEMQPTFLVLGAEPIRKFRRRNPGLVTLGEELLWIEWQLCSLIAHLDTTFSPIVSMNTMQIHEYHREALLLCMRDRANIGLALMRMSCELSLDVGLMASDPEAEKLWLAREEDPHNYKKTFRFDKLISPLGPKLRELYKLGCQFGVHGHIQFTEEPSGCVTIADKDFFVLPPDRKFRLTATV